LSKKIKAVYDADPTAGDDLTKEGLFAGDDGEDNEVVYTRTQVSNTVAEVGAVKEIADRVGALETSTVPDPTSAFWNATILDNTLTANVFVSAYTGEAWIIVKGSDVTPTDDSVGSTPPTGFTIGNPPSTYDMVTCASGDLYFYQWDQVNRIVEKLTSSGERGINIVPSFTIGPIFSGTPLAMDEVTETQLSYAISAATIQNPCAGGTVTYNLYDARDASIVIFDAGTSGTYPTVPGQTYAWYVVAFDQFNNATGSKETTGSQVTMSSTTAEGNIQFDAVEFQEDEDTGFITVTGSRGGLTSGALTFDVSTHQYVSECVPGLGRAFNTTSGVDAGTDEITTSAAHNWTSADDGDPVVYAKKGGSAAIGLTDHGTYYLHYVDADEVTLHTSQAEGISGANPVALVSTGAETHYLFDGACEAKASEQVSVGDGVDAWSVVIELVDRNTNVNSMFGLYIDDGSESAGVVGTINSVLIKIMGSATSSSGAWQEINDGTRNIVVIEAENFNTSVPGAGTGWTTTYGNSYYSNDAYSRSDETGTYGSSSSVDLASPAPLLQYDINFISTNLHYAWFRSRTSPDTTKDCFHCTYNGGAVAGITGIKKGRVGDGTYTLNIMHWTNDLFAGGRASFTPATGDQTFETVQCESAVTIDKIVLTDDAAYDPGVIGAVGLGADDENYGPDESGTGGTVTIIDNPENPALPIDPPPSGTLAATTLLPADLATGVSASVNISAEFVGATQPNNTIYTVTASGGTITGVTDSQQTATSTVIVFNPTALMVANTEYTVTLTGTIKDSTGVTKSISESWSFTTAVAAPSGDILFNLNFANHTIGDYTAQQVITDWNVGDLGYQDDWITVNNSYGKCQIIADPTPGARFGKVLDVVHYAGRGAGGMNWRADFGSGTAYTDGETDAYLYYEIYMPSSNGWHALQNHLPGMITGTRLEASHAAETPEVGVYPHDGTVSFTAMTAKFSADAYPAWPAGTMSKYIYSATSVQSFDFFNTLDPTSEAVSGTYVLPFDQWVGIEARVKMNDVGSSNGLMEVWVTDNTYQSKKVVERTNRIWRTASTVRCDGLWLYSYFGGNAGNPLNQGPVDQHFYYGNFIVSKTPISH